MRTKTRFAALAMATLWICLAGMAQAPFSGRSIPDPEDRIDINHASARQLLRVPGMTPSWAGRIIRFRPYHTKLDLMERGVVTSQVYDRIKDYVIAHRKPQ